MTNIASQLAALRQKHQFTIIQLTDLKEDYEKVKKINNTIIENLVNKDPSQSLQQIKLFIDGNFHNQQLIQLQSEIDRLNEHMNEEVQKRVKAITQKYKSNQNQECKHCKELQKLLQKKKELLDQKNIELEEVKADFDIMVSKRKGLEEKCQYLLKNNEKSEGKYSNMMRNMVDVKEVNHNLHILDQQWQNKYNQLLEQYDQIVDEFERYQDLKQNKQRQNVMKKTIKNLVGQISQSKRNTRAISTSRLTQESDYSSFSIKDAINRPQNPYF